MCVYIICSFVFIESFSLHLSFSLKTHLLSASLQLGQVQAMRLFFSAGWPGSSSVKVWSTWMADWPCVVASWSPPPCIVCTVRCCWPDKHRNRRTVRDTAGLLKSCQAPLIRLPADCYESHSAEILIND